MASLNVLKNLINLLKSKNVIPTQNRKIKDNANWFFVRKFKKNKTWIFYEEIKWHRETDVLTLSVNFPNKVEEEYYKDF